MNQPKSSIVTIRHEVLQAMLKAACRAVLRWDKKSSHKSIENILIRSTPESLKVVATDGHRLIQLDAIQQEAPAETVEVIIDPEGLRSFIQSSSGLVRLTFTKEQLEIHWGSGSVLLTNQKVDFPPFEQVIIEPYSKVEVSEPTAVFGKYMADIGAIAKDIAARGVTFDQRGPLDAIRIEFEGDAMMVTELKDKRHRLCDALMIQMPYRMFE